jgi:multidrug resistance efflux pump
MSEKVVLPKFDLPTESTHPAIKAVLIVGGVLVLSLAILGGAVWKRHAAQLAAEQRRDAVIAQKVAEANAVVEAAKARVAEAAAKEAAEKAKLEAAKLAAKQKADDAAAAKKAEKAAALAEEHHGHHHGGKAGGSGGKSKGASATVAAKSGDDKKSAPKSSRDNAAIDKLLASFK